ncbi:MAG TPA: HEAT repeat domain-containing protein [Caulobacteraceae bacterium]|jgi:HEAT repeat protein|nr:HEAT repeat domain-containing protein [Caulobacteraceae bacterium]
MTDPEACRLAADLVQAAAAGDPKALAQRPGVSRTLLLKVRDILIAAPLDRAIVVATYLKGLDHRNPRVRFECAHALDIFGDAACRAPLTALIDDPVPRVRWMAMHALACDGCKAEPFAADADLRGRIAERALSDPSIQVRRHAAWALGVLGGEGAARVLQVLLACETDAAVRRNAAAALRRAA